MRTGDLFLAGALTDSSISGDVDLAAGYDLSLLSLCNHTILSYGTFSYWAGVLAGGYIFALFDFTDRRILNFFVSEFENN